MDKENKLNGQEINQVWIDEEIQEGDRLVEKDAKVRCIHCNREYFINRKNRRIHMRCKPKKG